MGSLLVADVVLPLIRLSGGENLGASRGAPNSPRVQAVVGLRRSTSTQESLQGQRTRIRADVAPIEARCRKKAY